jgi:multicomponent Na+:H+ antiporter subunit B
VSRRVRTLMMVAALGGLSVVLALALGGLPGVGDAHGPNARSVAPLLAHERHVANAVNGVTYDLRATDTLGEELILFVAALGSAVLLRVGRGKDEDEGDEDEGDEDEDDEPPTSGALRVVGAVLVGPVLVLGAYVVTHGHLTPGGGFQGGVILAAALLLVYAAGQLVALEQLRPIDLVEAAEATGAVAFALVALGGLVFSGALLANFLATGSMGELLSAGTIPVLSVATGVEVTAALTLILSELLDQALLGEPG